MSGVVIRSLNFGLQDVQLEKSPSAQVRHAALQPVSHEVKVGIAFNSEEHRMETNEGKRIVQAS